MHARSLVAAAAILALSVGPAAARDLTVVARGARRRTRPGRCSSSPFTAATDHRGADRELGRRHRCAAHPGEGSGQRLGPRDGGQRRTGHRLLGGPVREARLVGDRRQGPLPAAGGERLRRRRRRRQPGAGLGSRQVPRHARLGGFLGRREVSRQARPASTACAATWSSRCSPTAWRPPTSTRCSPRPRASIARSASWISSSPTSCGGRTSAEAARILASGDVLMTSASAPRRSPWSNRTAHRNFGVQWAASLYEVQSWAILKGSPNLRAGDAVPVFRRDAGDRGAAGRPVRRGRPGQGRQ